MSNEIYHHRVFMAIPIDQDTQDLIHQTIQQSHPAHLPLRWIKKESYHITLHYLGSITQEQLELTATKLKPIIENYASFSLKLETSSGFPSSSKPHSLAVIVKLSFILNGLYEETKAILEECGVDSLPTRAYQPHITIAKAKNSTWVNNSKRLPSPIKVPVQEIQFLQSTGEDSSTPYTKLGTLMLTHHTVEA